MFNSRLDTRYYVVDEDVWILLFPTNIPLFNFVTRYATWPHVASYPVQ